MSSRLKKFSNRLEPQAKCNLDQKIVTLNSGFTIQMETSLILCAPGTGLYRRVAVD